MASASVTFFGVCEAGPELEGCKAMTVPGDRGAVSAFGSAGRFRANGPITAHPHFRMHRIPLELSWQRPQFPGLPMQDGFLFPGVAPRDSASWVASRVIVPRLRSFVYGGQQLCGEAAQGLAAALARLRNSCKGGVLLRAGVRGKRSG